MLPRNAKWSFINFVFRWILRLGISRSDLVMGMAHTKGTTRKALRILFHSSASLSSEICADVALKALHWAAAKVLSVVPAVSAVSVVPAASAVTAVSALSALSAVTALSAVAAKGNIRLVRWLLNNGAYGSIYKKNSMGCTPLDVARIFGPHPEASGCVVRRNRSKSNRRV